MSDSGFEQRIENLDISLFAKIPSQTTDPDRSSLLAVQRCVRESMDGYIYLEIGSHLGGSIQPHLLDPKCRKIFSIDKRPVSQADERGGTCDYPDNSTERMLALLGGVGGDQVKKIHCIDGDTKTISPSEITEAPNLCFVDGEHTPAALISDFEFCMKVCASGATIVFHDRLIVFRGLRSVVARLKKTRRKFSAHTFVDVLYVVCLDASPVTNRLEAFSGLVREDDLWSRRNDLRLLKWRALWFRERASRAMTNFLGAT
ncbi:MAG TPA: class I SAM-dependent methyltransferase [Candidatus Limnocylindrales bacterium]|nr:class I SAM-dependent methyltransferase [Candidatus Limnocylindrales bacterium]